MGKVRPILRGGWATLPGRGGGVPACPAWTPAPGCAAAPPSPASGTRPGANGASTRRRDTSASWWKRSRTRARTPGSRPRTSTATAPTHATSTRAELFAAFGAEQLRYAAQTWGGGGGAMCGAFLERGDGGRDRAGDYVVVHKVMTMEATTRYGQAFGRIGMKNPVVPGPIAFAVPYGLQSPGPDVRAGRPATHAPLRHDRATTSPRSRSTRGTWRATNPEARFRDPMHRRGPPREPDDRRPAPAVRLLHGVRLRLRAS